MLRGFHDVLDYGCYTSVHDKLRFCAFSLGSKEISVPILEELELFQRSIGESDAVQKEIFSFFHGDKAVCLRPELTTSMIRALENAPRERYFSIGPCFRGERPQKGRYREFEQFSVEFLDRNIEDCLFLVGLIIERLGLDATLKINYLGTEDDRKTYVEVLSKFLNENFELLSEESKERVKKNRFLRVLDSKTDRLDFPKITDYVKDKEYLKKIVRMVRSIGVSVEIDPFLVRGLDYYEGIVFEVIPNSNPNQKGSPKGSLAGGGQYVVEMNNKKIRSVGFAFGIDRLVEIESEKLDQKEHVLIEVKRCLRIGVSIMVDHEKAFSVYYWLIKTYGKQASFFSFFSLIEALRAGNKKEYDFVFILDGALLEREEIQVKNLKTGMQDSFKIEDLGSIFLY